MSARKATRPRLVRYVSPFGSPAWMPLADALRHLEEDDVRWVQLQALGLLDDHQRAIGAPRIEGMGR